MPRTRSEKGTVSRISVSKKHGKFSLHNKKTNKKESYFMWSPSDESAFDRITFSMWLSMLQTAIVHSWEIEIRHEADSNYIIQMDMPTKLVATPRPPRPLGDDI